MSNLLEAKDFCYSVGEGREKSQGGGEEGEGYGGTTVSGLRQSAGHMEML